MVLIFFLVLFGVFCFLVFLCGLFVCFIFIFSLVLFHLDIEGNNKKFYHCTIVSLLPEGQNSVLEFKSSMILRVCVCVRTRTHIKRITLKLQVQEILCIILSPARSIFRLLLGSIRFSNRIWMVPFNLTLSKITAHTIAALKNLFRRQIQLKIYWIWFVYFIRALEGTSTG